MGFQRQKTGVFARLIRTSIVIFLGLALGACAYNPKTGELRVATPDNLRPGETWFTPRQLVDLWSGAEYWDYCERHPCPFFISRPPDRYAPRATYADLIPGSRYEAATQLYGAFFQASAGGGRSVTSEGSESGKGSGTTVDVSFGWRQRLAGHNWQALSFGATVFDRDERFQAPFDDLHVKPGVILYQSYMLGPNFPGFSAGQNFAPYAEVGIAEANIKVSADVGSATRWNVAPLVGAGMDYRLNSQWLIHAGVRVFFFGEKNYQLAPGTTFRVSDRATSATVGLIYQFDSSQF
jgi:opacity protein-like surface antigen